MATEVDIITKRPRTPNDQYTVLTDEQIRNIDQDSSTFFHTLKRDVGPPANGFPREGGRYYMDRYAALTSRHLLSGQQQTCPTFMWIGDQKRNDLPSEYTSCRGMASVKWGPQKIGEHTRSHFYGENVERYTLIDAYRRPATCYAGRVVMDCGRPGDGYYAQRYPDRTSWFRTSAPLNCRNVLQSVHRKPESRYDEIRQTEEMVRRMRTDLWPEYTEYTDKYLLQTRTTVELAPLEKAKLHAAEGQRLQKQEMEEKAAMEWQKQQLKEMAAKAELSESICRAATSPVCRKLPLLAA